MGIRLAWLDWDKACLPQAAAWLIDRQQTAAGADSICDLQQVACVLSGARAGRLLLGHLIRECQARKRQLIPPRIHTPGSLVSSLVADQPVASDVEMELAWAAALRQADRDTIKPLLPFAPEESDELAWQSLARTIAGLHADLAGGCRSFSDVADLAERMELFGEGDRWRALTRVHSAYRQCLHAIGLRDRHDVIDDVLSRSRVHLFTSSALRDLVLIAAPELNAIQRRVIAAADERATSLIHAPRNMADRFDDLGCVIPDRWQDAIIRIKPSQMISADRPADQAQHALRTIAGFDGRYSAREITIGLGDPALAHALDHAATWAEVRVRDAAGTPLCDTPPCRALQAIGEYLNDPRFATFAALLRHPDIERWIWSRTRESDQGVRDWLTLLDTYFQNYLDERCAGPWLGDATTATHMKSVHEAMHHLLAGLHAKNGNGNGRMMDQSSRPHSRTMIEWAQPLLNVLAELYRHADESPHAPGHALRISACREIRESLAALAAAAPALQPRVTAADAIALLMEHIGHAALPQRDEPDTIEMLGWLELHLDPAPALIITGVNEGHIPKSATSDPFLPDSLREKLGLACNTTRYARDAYLLEAILHSREHVTLIAGRRSHQGEALTPSRLLLACDESELVERVKRLCDERASAGVVEPIGMCGLAASASRFVVPDLPLPLPPIDSMRITDFRAYMACPYRFALGRLLGLQALDDSARELDPLQFGSLAHEVLCAMGENQDLAACEDAEIIEKFLMSDLRQRVPAQFGSSPGAAVRVQVARLELRLRAFANLQANLCREGWRIRFCELPFRYKPREAASGGEPSASDAAAPQNIALDVPGQDAMPLRGKIDRIDFNERTGAWRIIDYKTGESGESPHKSHTGREKCDSLQPEDWQDLQLPLYHYLATRSTLNIQGDIQLAYICLPKQLDGVALKAAQWTPEHLAQAHDVARDIVRKIRAGDFLLNRAFTGFDDFARICQTTAYLDDEQPQEVEA